MGEHDDDLEMIPAGESGASDAMRVAAAITSGLRQIALAIERGLDQVAAAIASAETSPKPHVRRTNADPARGR